MKHVLLLSLVLTTAAALASSDGRKGHKHPPQVRHLVLSNELQGIDHKRYSYKKKIKNQKRRVVYDPKAGALAAQAAARLGH